MEFLFYISGSLFLSCLYELFIHTHLPVTVYLLDSQPCVGSKVHAKNDMYLKVGVSCATIIVSLPQTSNVQKPSTAVNLVCHALFCTTLPYSLSYSSVTPIQIDQVPRACFLIENKDLLQITPCFLCILAMRRTRRKRSSSQFKIMPDTQNINAWMGYCGGTDPYCQQGCTPTCGTHT